MKKRRSFLAALAAASVVLAGSHLAPSPVAAAGKVFDAGTVAHRYNFTFSGRGGDGNAIAIVGWFEVDAEGDVVDGAARSSSSLVGLPVSRRATLDSTADNRMAVSDPDNGIYDLTLRFVGPVVAPTQLTLSVVLDDRRGRSGKVGGEYTYQSTEIGGVGVGEIAIQ